MDIKIPHKYLLFRYNQTTQSIKLILTGNKISDIKTSIKGIKIPVNNEILLMKLVKEKLFKPNATGLAKLIAGPIKITFKLFEVSDTNILVPKYESILNKKGTRDTDKRNSQFLFVTPDYLKENNKTISQHDLKLIGLLAFQYKLEKRPLASKTIEQINKLK
jgi:hypothetical protein